MQYYLRIHIASHHMVRVVENNLSDLHIQMCQGRFKSLRR